MLRLSLCIYVQVCVSCTVQWDFEDPIRPASLLVIHAGAHVCFFRVFCDSAGCWSHTVIEKPWVGWLLSSLRRLITLSAQWWSCLEIIYDSSTVPLVPVSQIIIRYVLNWQIISDPHSSLALIFFCFKKNIKKEKIQTSLTCTCTQLFRIKISHGEFVCGSINAALARDWFQNPDIYHWCFGSLKQFLL